MLEWKKIEQDDKAIVVKFLEVEEIGAFIVKTEVFADMWGIGSPITSDITVVKLNEAGDLMQERSALIPPTVALGKAPGQGKKKK